MKIKGYFCCLINKNYQEEVRKTVYLKLFKDPSITIIFHFETWKLNNKV